MIRKVAALLLVFVATSFFAAPAADAGPISPNNPYRSFNISGINYGSMQWERQHRGTRSGYVSRGFFFRRR